MINFGNMARIVVSATLMTSVGLSYAAVSPEEAAALGDTLTLFGAERAGNEDGSIPEYTGGLAPVPGYDRDSMQTYIDPFKDESPLYTIDSNNMSEYEDLLTEGTKALLNRYPSYRVNVYPTHRTARYLDWVLEGTVKNATTAKMVGQIEGDEVIGEGPNGRPHPGVPFPIPQNGYEVMWNHKIAFAPAVMHQHNQAYLVDRRGGVSALSTPDQYHMRPWYDRSGDLRARSHDAILSFSALQTSPPRAAGITFLNFYLASADNGGQRVWFYTPGQRRARAAPDFAYDLPISAYGGVLLWDEIFGFVGRMDRFDFSLVGKKEMIVPYNAFQLTQRTPARDALGTHHVDPDVMRFEKHRVWVVEAERKAGARHVYQKRRFYINEDSWQIVALESYDDAGDLWRSGHIHTFPTYDVGGVNNNSWVFDDLQTGNYMIINVGAADSGFWNRSYMSADGLRMPLTPRAVEAQGVR